MRFAHLFSVLFVCASLTACSTVGDMFGSEDGPPLPGQRISILELQKRLEPDSAAAKAAPITLPAPWRNEYWPQSGGYPNHSMQHLALGTGDLKHLWTAKIGRGSSKALPLTAQPILVDGRIFAMDTDSTLSAFSIEDGKRLWEVDVRALEEDDPVIGGGLAYAAGQIYVTNGYNEILALSAQNGALTWRAALPAAARGAPTVMDDRVFVTTLDNRLVAMNAASGAVLWDYEAIADTTSLVGAASPAAGRDIVVPAFSSGELLALHVENGVIAWSDNLSSARYAGTLAGLSDISGLPVIDRNLVIAVGFGGHLTAIDERTGERIWQREIGGTQTPWVAGDYVFILSANNEVVALDRYNGSILWVSPLPRYKNPDSKSGPVFWAGPVLAGERLIAAGSHGEIAELSPQTGEVIRHWDAGSSFSIPPLVAGGVLYLLDDNGTLSAYK